VSPRVPRGGLLRGPCNPAVLAFSRETGPEVYFIAMSPCVGFTLPAFTRVTYVERRDGYYEDRPVRLEARKPPDSHVRRGPGEVAM
jgi:hypothetical protein